MKKNYLQKSQRASIQIVVIRYLQGYLRYKSSQGS